MIIRHERCVTHLKVRSGYLRHGEAGSQKRARTRQRGFPVGKEERRDYVPWPITLVEIFDRVPHVRVPPACSGDHYVYAQSGEMMASKALRCSHRRIDSTRAFMP